MTFENWRALTIAAVDDEDVKAAITAAIPPGIVHLVTRAEEMQSAIEYIDEGARQELRLLVRLDSREGALCDAHGTREAVSEAFTFRPVRINWAAALGKGQHGTY
jgi:hypothetical protein